jgi:hypothetical protein
MKKLNITQERVKELFDFDEAVCTRLAGEQCLNYDSCDTNSTAYQYVQQLLSFSS